MLNKTVSHYRIIEKLGEGGMGIVYKAQDIRLDRIVALKFLPERIGGTVEDLARFQQESKAVSALNHPNIATIHDVEEADGQKFLVLEYLPGGTLKQKVAALNSAGRNLPIAVILDYGIHIAEALGHAHRHHIVHRDVKTDNVMLTEDGDVKLTDFGLAKLRGSVDLTKSGSTLGTAAYMSPEQIRGEDVDERSDVFSLGVVLYELTTLRLPFRGDHEAAIAYSITNEEPAPVRSLRPDAPEELERIINGCIEKDLSKRYQRTDQIVSALRSLRQESTGAVKIIARRSKVPWLIVAGVILIASAGIYLLVPPASSTSHGNKTVAVLPFANLGGAQEDEYFSDGITEDILTQLSKIADLNVISRTSVIQYKGTKKTIREIGRELNAGYVLEGSVRRSGTQVRIGAQLIDAANDRHLWAETYDKEITKIFAIQSEVAQKIAAALQARLQPAEKGRIEKVPTASTEAYNAYLKGREYYYRYRQEDNEIAMGLFRRAIAWDTSFALAWAGLADAEAQQAGRFGLSRSWLDSSLAAGMKAVELDGASAEAYKALGTAYFYKGEGGKVLENSRKSVALNPNYYPAVANIGNYYVERGLLDEALPWIKKAIVLNPTSAIGYLRLGDLYRQLENWERAWYWFDKALQLQPDYSAAVLSAAFTAAAQGNGRKANGLVADLLSARSNDIYVLSTAGIVAGLTGDFARAEEYHRRVLAASPSSETDLAVWSALGLGHILLRNGKRDEAHDLLAKARSASEKKIAEGDVRYDPCYVLAACSAVQGERKEANAWLKKAVENGWRDHALTNRDPWMENLRDDPDFIQTMKALKRSLEEMRKKIEILDKE